jgi:hypothetical protein
MRYIMMKRQLQGIVIILCSILLAVTFNNVGWNYIGDIDLMWQHLFMIAGIIGAVVAFLPDRKK